MSINYFNEFDENKQISNKKQLYSLEIKSKSSKVEALNADILRSHALLDMCDGHDSNNLYSAITVNVSELYDKASISKSIYKNACAVDKQHTDNIKNETILPNVRLINDRKNTYEYFIKIYTDPDKQIGICGYNNTEIKMIYNKCIIEIQYGIPVEILILNNKINISKKLYNSSNNIQLDSITLEINTLYKLFDKYIFINKYKNFSSINADNNIYSNLF
jgi:hypothetical protein